ncbi:hypothetical protein BGZ96_005169 [Linnemannia gamsii]|uniref:RNI-like protein n=1 Tax=Linnemannia gamsii TaxID=64522 RepID=A0ABQ7K5R5_9FUNG|nr:hypothetical protein BGZ96_005169 [Linnemannia gamsii]
MALQHLFNQILPFSTTREPDNHTLPFSNSRESLRRTASQRFDLNVDLKSVGLSASTSRTAGVLADTKADQFELRQLRGHQHKPSAAQRSVHQQPHHQHHHHGHQHSQHTNIPFDNTPLDHMQYAVEDLAIASPPISPKATAQGSWKPEQTVTSTILHRDTARVDVVRAKVLALLRQRFLVHEYTIPRLFVVLPVEAAEPLVNSNTNTSEAAAAAAGTRTGTESGSSGLNHLHIAKHPGYEIDPGREDEFFRRYGPMILVLLIFLRNGYDPSDESPPSSSRSAPPKHSKDDPQFTDAKETLLKRVNRISTLKAADLPDAIARQVEQKVDGMIAYLEQLRMDHQESSNSTENNNGDTSSGAEMDTKADGKKSPCASSLEDQQIQGLTSLSDLHQLYSFLGLSTIGKRVQSGQLANLYRISNVRGQVSWVCVYHYRWTFLEKNIDDFEHWIVTRRGHFDKQTGSVSMTLVSRANTRTFCSWITNKVAPSLVEVHLKLGWKFGKKDLWRLANAFASSTITVLSLDGCTFAGHSSYKNVHKKYDPILYLLTHGQLRSLELQRFPSMFSRLSSKAVKSTSLRRLELGAGMTIDTRDLESFSQLIKSCSSLQELILPAFPATGLHMQAIMNGARATASLVTLDLSNSEMDEGAAIILAQGLFNSHICHLDLSRNEQLSDIGAARIIRAIGPRLASLKMAQTRFGDMAAVALSRSMDGISITSTLQDQLMMQHRLDIAALTAGHRPGLRIRAQDPMVVTTELKPQVIKEKIQSAGCLVYLDIEDNECTVKGFRALAHVKSHLFFVYLNLSGSKGLEDDECAAILDHVASAEMRALRLSCTGFGDLSALALTRSFSRFQDFTTESGPLGRESKICQLEELDLHGCPITIDGFSVLSEGLRRAQSSSRLKSLDLGHCGGLEDETAYELLKEILLPNGSDRMSILSELSWHRRVDPGSHSLMDMASILKRGTTFGGRETLSDSRGGGTLGGENRNRRRIEVPGSDRPLALLVRSDSTPIMPSSRSGVFDSQLGSLADGTPMQLDLHPPRTILPLPHGFFANLQQLDFKSTQIGDSTAWLLAQALTQPWVMISSLTLLEPTAMTSQGMCWIVEALCDNSSVQDFAIGKSNLSLPLDMDLFGSSLVNLMEINKRIRSLTVLGAPFGSVAKGLLLNQSLHSIYIIRSRGQPDDVLLMGQALSFNRSLLIFWMGGTDKSLLGGDDGGTTEQSNQDPNNPLYATTSSQERHQDEQGQQQQQQSENVYRNFHLQHQQEEQQQRQRLGHYASLGHGQSMSQKIGDALKSKFSVPSRDQYSQSDTTYSRQQQQQQQHRLSMTSRTVPRPVTSVNDDTRLLASSSSSPWTRNPIMEGIRRNHSLIKVTVDIFPPPGSRPGRPGGAGGLSKSTTMHGTPARNSMAMDLTPQEQAHWSQQQQVDKIIYANRKNLRERSRIAWEELKLLGVDEDVIREVFVDLF